MNSSPSTAKEAQSPDRRQVIAFCAAMGIALISLVILFALNPFASGYGANIVPILQFANVLWSGDSGDWTHCYLVPFAVAAMVYHRRRELHFSQIGPCWTGLGVLIFGFLVYGLGFRADNIYLGYASFQILVAGLLLWICGWQWFKTLFFAWAFLVFLYPVPFLDNVVAFPLRIVMSQASVDVLNFIGIASIKTGTAILSAPDAIVGLKTGDRFSVDVADPCSGIRSLFALMMVSALYGYFTQPGIWRKIVMFLCSAPLAVLGNLARILMLTIGTLAFGSDFAIGTIDDPSTFHMWAGFLVFIVALGGLMGIGSLLSKDWAGTFARLKAKNTSSPRQTFNKESKSTDRCHDEY